MILEYKPGDVIQNIPYEGEPAYLVDSFDNYGYICIILDDSIDVKNMTHIFFDAAHKFYKRINQ